MSALAAAALVLLLAAPAAAAIMFLRWAGQRRDRGDLEAHADQAIAVTGWHKTPVPPLTRGGAGPNPGPGLTASPQTNGTPGPGPARIFTVHYYGDGHCELLDHRNRRRFFIPGEPAPAIDLSDAALREFLDGQH